MGIETDFRSVLGSTGGRGERDGLKKGKVDGPVRKKRKKGGSAMRPLSEYREQEIGRN